jgi:hypothetical protein
MVCTKVVWQNERSSDTDLKESLGSILVTILNESKTFKGEHLEPIINSDSNEVYIRS